MRHPSGSAYHNGGSERQAITLQDICADLQCHNSLAVLAVQTSGRYGSWCLCNHCMSKSSCLIDHCIHIFFCRNDRRCHMASGRSHHSCGWSCNRSSKIDADRRVSGALHHPFFGSLALWLRLTVSLPGSRHRTQGYMWQMTHKIGHQIPFNIKL